MLKKIRFKAIGIGIFIVIALGGIQTWIEHAFWWNEIDGLTEKEVASLKELYAESYNLYNLSFDVLTPLVFLIGATDKSPVSI